MFIGHLAVGFAGKRVAPETSLQASILAAGFADLLWSAFLILGLEVAHIHPGDTAVVPIEFVSYPWSHSLLMTLVWAAAFAGVYGFTTGSRRGARWVGAAVLSHWFLDFASHRADMSLYPGGPRLGLGLYDSLAGTAAVEGALFAAGLWIYCRATRPKGWHGTAALASFVVFILALYTTSLFSPPPPDIQFVAAGNLLFLPSLMWAAWIDRSRTASSEGL